MGRRTMVMVVVSMVVMLVLALAWIDGGREDQRLIESPVSLPLPAAPGGGA